MAITRWLVMICISHNLLKTTRSSEFEEPSVQEGVPYSLNCSATLNELFMQFSWTDKAGKSITRCKDTLVCDEYERDKYEVKMDKNNSTLTSILIKRNVTMEDRGSMFICEIVYKNSMEKKKWKLSKTYYLPSSKCEAHFIEGQTVHLSCETLNVYPGITCDILERHNGTETKLNTTMATKRTELFPGYVSENCSVIIYPRLPGKFEYCVNVKVKDRDNVPYKPFCMKNITIRFKPTLTILQADDYTQPCPGENMKMKCQLLWWQSSSAPTMLWYLDDKLVNSNDTQVRSSFSLESTYNYESFYSFIPNYSKTRLRCEICSEYNLRDNITKRIINATKEISLIWPPPQPKISYQEVVKENGSEFTVAVEQNVSLKCVTGSAAFEASTVCSYSSHSILHEMRGNVSVSFVFKNYTRCSCYAIHLSKYTCGVYSTIIFIDTETYSRMKNSTQFASIYFIIPALILLFAAGIFITLVVYLKKRRRDFQIYWQGCHGNSRLCCLIFHNCAKFEYSETTRSDKKGRKSRENTTPYAVVDIINKSDAPGTDTNFSNPTIKEPSDLLQTGPPPSPEQQPHMSSFSSPSSFKLITTENDGLNISHGPFLDNCLSMKGNSGVNDKRQEETPLSSLPPPLPPRSKHGVRISRTPDSPLCKHDVKISRTSDSTLCKHDFKISRTSDSTLCKQGDNINRNKLKHHWVSLTRPTNAERFHDDRQYSQSVPKRQPPPIPCRSNVINFVQISSFDFCDQHNRPACHVVHEHVESKDVFSGAEATNYNRSYCRESPDYIWPPPPTREMNKRKTKKTRYKTRNTSKHPDIKDYHFCPAVKDDKNFKEEQTTMLPSQREVDIVTTESTVHHGQEIPPNKCINHANKDHKYKFSGEGMGEINYGDWNHEVASAGCRESGSDLSLLSVFVNTELRSSLENDFVSDITSPS